MDKRDSSEQQDNGSKITSDIFKPTLETVWETRNNGERTRETRFDTYTQNKEDD